MRQVLGIGECMVELSEVGNGTLRQSFAGDVFNTLWYSRKALDDGWSVGFLSTVGTDPLSDQMLAFIEGSGVETSRVRRIPERRPGLYMIHLDGAERSFSYWRDHSAARLLAADRAHLAEAMAAASVIYFSGITLAILSSDDAEGFLDCVAEARAEGKTVVFDPNLRPALWETPERLRETVERAARQATLVLPSYDDEARAFGDGDPAATLTRYLSYGADLVVLKNGEGDILVGGKDGRSTVYATEPVAAPLDTTGAGDSFNGAFLAEYLISGDIGSSVRAGQLCAAEVVCHRGALVASGLS